MNNPTAQIRSSRLLTLIATILIIAVLYLAQAVLIPIALAILLCLLLGPLVDRLERWGIGRVPSVLAVTLLSFAAIGGVGYVVALEAIALADTLPQYKDNISNKVRALTSPGALSRATDKIRKATEEVMKASTQPEDPAATKPGAATAPAQAPEPKPPGPMIVTLAEPATNPLTSLTHTFSPILPPLGTAGIIVIFVIFMLIQREDLRDRLIGLVGPSQVNLTTKVIDDAVQRVSRYLLMQFIVNLSFGLSVSIGLYFIGLPNAALWGALCTVLRYIPYVGAWLGAAMPILLALATSDGWTRPFEVIGLFIVLELITSNVLEPWLYGSGTGISPVAVLVAAAFWTWLWGVPGLVLATPLTVCVVVIGRYLPQMEWLSLLLGDKPGLPLPARVYQRLLAMDHEEVFDIAEDYLKTHTLAEWYQEVLLPALSLAEHDRHRALMDEVREQTVYAGMRSLIEELGERPQEKVEGSAKEEPGAAALPAAVSPPAAPAHVAERPLTLIVAARDQADELSGLMLCQLMTREGLRCETLPTGTLAAEIGEHAAQANPAVVCISAMPPMAVAHARYVCKRVHARLPKTRVMVGLWNATEPQRAVARLKSCGADVVVATFSETIEKLRM